MRGQVWAGVGGHPRGMSVKDWDSCAAIASNLEEFQNDDADVLIKAFLPNSSSASVRNALRVKRLHAQDLV